MSKKYPRNALCPCGSGKKYKYCCIDKDFDWVINNGQISRATKIGPEMADLLEIQRQKFIDKYGREPGPNDPIFFDIPSEAELEKATIEMLEKAGVSDEYIYAYKKTGRLVTEQNRNKLTDLELKEWDEAIAEYKELQ